MADESQRLAPRVEALLQAMPTSERGDWEIFAEQIDRRVRETEAKSTAPLWLMAPLPDEPHEPGAQAPAASSEASSDSATRNEAPREAPPSARAEPAPSQTPTTSLADLARSFAPKDARPEAANIAKESISLAAAARVHSDGLVERVRSARPTPLRSADVAPPPPPPSARVAAAVSAPSGRRSELGPWIAIGGLGAALAAALMVIVFRREPAQIVVAAPPAAPVSAAATPPVAARAQAPAAGATPREEPATAEASNPVPLAASALPLSPKNVAPVAPPRASNEAVAVASRASTPGVTRPLPEQIKLEETPPQSKPLAEAPSAPASGMRPAAGSASSGGLPDRPSTGAVQAAIGSVMSPARACVAGGAAAPAQITFGSDGSVSSVAVSGTAAGTPAASCIEAALKRARVAPFTNHSFSLNIWVRP